MTESNDVALDIVASFGRCGSCSPRSIQRGHWPTPSCGERRRDPRADGPVVGNRLSLGDRRRGGGFDEAYHAERWISALPWIYVQEGRKRSS